MNPRQRKLEQENARLRAALTKANAKIASSTDQHTTEINQLGALLEERQRMIATLEHRLKLLLQKVTGSRQERIDPDQLLLFSNDELKELLAQLDQGDPQSDLLETDDATSSSNKKPKTKRGRSGKLPAHLVREIVRHELSETEQACPCCGEQRHEIGVETSEQLELVPAVLKVIQHERVKYACRSCQENVSIAAKPPQPIEKGLPGPGLCAHTVLSKFGDHLPLYRQEDISSRLGMTIGRSTLCGW